jgi:hypothetical protein
MFIEPQLHAREIIDWSVVAKAGLCSENHCVPRLSFWDISLWQEQVHMLALDRHGLVLVFEYLDAQAIRGVLIGLIEAAIAARLYGHTGSLPLGHLLLHVVYDEAHVVDHRSDRRAIGWRCSWSLIERDDDDRETSRDEGRLLRRLCLPCRRKSSRWRQRLWS